MYFVHQILILIFRTLLILFLPPRRSCSPFFKSYLESLNVPSAFTTSLSTHWAFMVHWSIAGLSILTCHVLQLFCVHIITATSFQRLSFLECSIKQCVSCIVDYLQNLIKLNWFEMCLTILCKYVSNKYYTVVQKNWLHIYKIPPLRLHDKEFMNCITLIMPSYNFVY